MTSDRWQQISQLFHAALALDTNERAAFLDDACAGDNALLREVESLLAQQTNAEQLLKTPALQVVARRLAASPGEPLTGQRLAHYRIAEKIGAGGMGEVYRAHDEQLRREVAIKVLPPELVHDPERRNRLLREARAVASLNHPNICTVHEVSEAQGQAYIVMELVEGEPLNTRLDRGPLDADEELRYGLQLADALSHAHARGVMHRDFKSANVVITPEGRAKVLDFGLAKRLIGAELPPATTESQALTKPGVLVGTLAYMAPEQLRGQPAEAHSDVWALGVVLYEMAAGTRPFQGQTAFELSSAILNQSPPPLPPRVPTALQAVIERCLEKDPGRRYKQGRDVRAALETIEGGAVTGSVSWTSRLTRVTLAILPFENLSGDPDQEYLSDGLTQEMIAQVGRLHPQRLGVIARRSSMQYKKSDKPIDQIGRELAVEYVLEGSVRREAGRVRVTAQLIHARDQMHVWADTYERPLAGILALQTDVSRGVAKSLALSLLPDQESRWARSRSVNPEAYEAYLRGMSYLQGYTAADFERALASLQRAIELDSSEPLSHAGLALAYSLSSHGPGGSFDAGRRAKTAALRALELDDSLAEIHEALALIRMYHDYDFEGAERSFRRALDLNPNLAAAHAHSAWLHAVYGRRDEALTEARLPTEIDPFEALWLAFLAWIHLWRGELPETMAVIGRALDVGPTHPVALYVLGIAYVKQGMYEDAIAAHQKAWAVTPDWGWGLGQVYALVGRGEEARRIAAELAEHPTTWRTWGLAEIYTALGDKDEAFRWLEAAYEQRNGYLPWIDQDPFFRPLRDDPRFQDLLRRMNVPRE